MNPILETFILSLLPVIELRGGIPYGILMGLHPLLVFIVAVVANLLVIPIVYFFLEYLHHIFYKLSWYQKLFHILVERSREKLEKHLGTKKEAIALFLLVAIPLPGTGAYTGTLLAWFFGIKKKLACKMLSLGVVLAGVLVTLFVLIGKKGFLLLS